MFANGPPCTNAGVCSSVWIRFEKTGTGFSFSNYNAHEMLNTVRYAERIYYDKKRDWNKMIERAMTQDFSWMNSARQYEDLYRSLIGE